MTPTAQNAHLFTITGSCSDAVVAMAQTLDLDLDFLPSAEHADLLEEVNPLRTVPTLSSPDGDVLTETTAILNHLARTRAPQLLPKDSIGLARLDEMMAFLTTSVYSAFLLHFRPDRSSDDASAHASIRSKAKRSINSALDELQRRVGNRRFVLGDTISTADFLALVMLRWAGRINPEFLQQRLPLRALLFRLEEHVAVHSAAAE